MNYVNRFHQFQEIAFNIFIATSWSLIMLNSIGILTEYPQAFIKVAFYVKIYVCLFLIWRFNPIRHFLFHNKIIFTELDRKIAFSAGLIVLSNTAINNQLAYIKSETAAANKEKPS